MAHAFSALSPETVMSAVESVGLYPAGEPFALNSYENRVLMFQDDDRARWVVKFYRPERLSDAAIGEEHAFLLELADAGIPVGAPWCDEKGQALHRFEGFRFTLFPHCSGRAPELDNPAHLFALGEVLGRLHAQSSRKAFAHRRTLELSGDIERARSQVMESPWLDSQQRRVYPQIIDRLLAALGRHSLSSANFIRTHGDCHLGNILGVDDAFTLVDFDDCLMAPAIQDIWMLLPEDAQEWRTALSEVREGYEESRPFPDDELALIEPLRAYRLVRHVAWLVSRWEDPAFPPAFPWLADRGHWDQHLRQLEQQLMQLEQPRWLA